MDALAQLPAALDLAPCGVGVARHGFLLLLDGLVSTILVSAILGIVWLAILAGSARPGGRP